MRTLWRLRKFSILWLATFVLACFNDAVAQASYQVTDLGTLFNGYFGCTMGLNSHGGTETQYGFIDASGKLVQGHLAINVGGFTLDLGTLGGANTWDNPFGGEINDRGQAVGFSETAALDPNGEDICGFGTHHVCLPFLWQDSRMSALPTLGGNNGQATAMNNRGEIAGFAENGIVDSTCSSNTVNNRIQLPVLWEKGIPQPLPTLTGDLDGVANAINQQGQAVGSTGTCGGATIHAVSWATGNASQLLDFGTGAIAFGINEQGQIVGTVGSADNTTQFGALWQNGALTNLHTLPGDFAAIASGINNLGQVVGSTLDSSFVFVRAFIWQNNVMTDLSTLFPASANLYPTMANQINDRGQIVGMATVLSGPHTGETHAFLATPVNQSIGRSMADVAPAHPKSNLPASVNKQFLQRFALVPFGR